MSPSSPPPTPAPPSLSALAIRQHIGTLMLTLTVIVLGVFCLLRLPVDLLPAITYPRIGLRLDAPGLSPEVAVEEITRPLERSLAATDGVEQIFSQTREGRVSIDLFFRPGGNLDRALNDATATLNRARSSLPEDIESPRLFKFDPSQLPVYEFALTSATLPGRELRIFAEEELARELNAVPGVASVEVSGGAEEEIQVNLDLERLQSLGLGLMPVLETLRDRNQDSSGGRLEGGGNEALTRAVGRFGSARELEEISFSAGPAGGSLGGTASGLAAASRRVYLRDFAEVVDGEARQRVQVSLNGAAAVKLSVQKQPDANTVQVVDRVKTKLADLRAGAVFPEDAVLTATLDESRFIRNSIANVTSSGLLGAGLAAIAVLLFLGSLRQTLIIVLAIPLASLVAIALMQLFGLSLNVFSLGGLAIGVGIVVDNSIVMLEAIAVGVNQHLALHPTGAIAGTKPGTKPELKPGLKPGASTEHRGLSPSVLLAQAQASSQELESALVASTLTNLVAVVPFLLIGGFISLLFNELILTISFAVAASLGVALTVVPMLTSRLLGIRWRSGVEDWWPLRQFRLRLLGLTRGYQGLLAWILRWRLGAIALVVIVLGGGSWQLAQGLPQEVLPRIDTGQAQLIAQFPVGTTLAENHRAMAAIDQVLLQQPEVDYVFSTAGGTLFGTTTSANPLRGSSTITLKPNTSVQAFTARATQVLAELNLVQTRLRLAPQAVRGLVLNNSPLRGADLDVILTGNSPQLVAEAGQQLMAALDDQARLARYRPDGETPIPEVQIRPDWERASGLGLTMASLETTLRTAVSGTVPTQLQRQDRSGTERLVDIRVQLQGGSLQTPTALEQLPLLNRGGQIIRLGEVATLELGREPGEIQRINQRPVFLVAGNLAEGARLGEAIAELEDILRRVELPPGVRLLPSAIATSSASVQQSVLILGSLAAFLVFVVMAVQYNSLRDPLVIMVTIPLALAGGILGLTLTRTPIGATVLVGAVLLVGIVVNNAILLVELANQIRHQEKVSATLAMLKAAPQRLQPILMTTITTVLGMLPLALGQGQGSEFLQPLGIVIFSGLALATLLTLFLVPCLYALSHEGFEG